MASPIPIPTAANLIHQAKMARAARQRLAREDAATFLRMVMRDELTGEPIQLADPMHFRWHDLAQQHDRLVLLSHVEAGKTTSLSVGRVLWALGRNPSSRVAVVSNTNGQAQKIVRAIAGYLERSQALREVFPRLRPSDDGPWTSSQLTVDRRTTAKDPSVQACGVHGSIVGARIDLLILDDLLDYENTRTQAQREDVWLWVHSTLFSRLTAKARVICVGNAYHQDDLLHRLEKNPRWHTERFPVVSADGIPSWPERWSLARISQKRDELGPVEFARQMLCQARDDTAARFKREWIERCLARGAGRSLVHALPSVPAGCAVYTGVDLAVQQHSGADLTVLFTIMVHPDGTREVLNIESGRFAGPEIVQRIQQVHHRYQGIVIVENNACFVPGTQVLTSTGYKPIESVQVGDQVWTHMGRWRPVTELHQGTSRTLVTAAAQGVLPVRATPNHWFWLREAGRTPGRHGGHYRPTGEPQWISYGVRDREAYAAIARPKWPACAPVLHVPATPMRAAYDVPVTEELALVLGLFMAEGHATRGQVSWTLTGSADYLADLIEAGLRPHFRGSITRSTHQVNTLRVTASNVQLARLLHIGTYADKCLPLEWMGWPLPLRLALVRGWLLGDGCAMQNNKRTKWPVWLLSGQTISRNWAMFVRATLHDAEITSTLGTITPHTSTIGDRVIRGRGGYRIALSRDDSRKLRALMTHPAEAARWARWWVEDTREALHASNVRLVYDGAHGWSKVPQIEEAPYQAYDGPVYNLTVAEDHSYTVEEFIVHNAQEFILQFTRSNSAVPVRPFTTGRNKAHPEFGVEGLATEMANGKWIIPSGNGKLHPEVDAWVNELLYYDPRAHTGDRLMAAYFAREGARMGSVKAEVGSVQLLRR